MGCLLSFNKAVSLIPTPNTRNQEISHTYPAHIPHIYQNNTGENGKTEGIHADMHMHALHMFTRAQPRHTLSSG